MWSIILTTAVVIEIITLIGRFGFNISTKRIWIKTMNKLGKKHWFHFHHVFLGLIIILISLVNYNPFILALGIGIAVSDIIHHLILWVVVGNPEFHILYKDNGKSESHKGKVAKHLVKKI